MSLSFPKYLSIQTTSLCNASCIFCPYKDIKNLFPTKIMGMDLYKKIIDECAYHKDLVKRIILYMNNEPLTDPYLIERINYAKDKLPKSEIHILTNGLLLTERMSEQILNSRLDWIGISFHGIRRETIEKSMGIPFEIALGRINQFIEKAKEKKDLKRYLMITFLKHKYLTEEEIKETIDYWRKRGIERINFFHAPVSRAGNVSSVSKIYRKEKIVGCKSIWTDQMIHIVEDGKVILCCMDWKREVILGDLTKEDIYEIWNGRRKDVWGMINGYKEMPENFLCRRCEEAIIEKEKKSVLLVNLPPWGIDKPYLGIACLATYLNKNQIPTQVFDFNIELYNLSPSHYRYLWNMNYSYWWVDKFDFIRDILGAHIGGLIERIMHSPQMIIKFSLPSNWSYLLLEEIVKKIKEKDKNKIIILGGISVSIKEHRLDLLKKIKDYVDYCILGEGEKALYELVKNILAGNTHNVEKIKGVLTKDTFFANKDKAEIKSFDELPFPTFEEFDLKKYAVQGSLPIEFSRGCIGNCPFCDFKIISPKFKKKSPSYIIDQIRYYIENYKITHLSIVDSAVNGDIENLEKLCELLIKHRINVRLSALAIPRKEMVPDLLYKMKKAGFYRLEYGVESGSDKILKSMRKIFTSSIAERVIRDTYQAGIQTHLYFIVGFPGEGDKEFNETKEFLKRVAPYVTEIRSINPLYVMAGSEIFYNPEKYGIIIPQNEGDRKWYTKEKDNTFDIRRERVLELKNLAKKLNISFTEEAESLEFTLRFIKEKKEKDFFVSQNTHDSKTIDSSKKSNYCDFLLVNLPPWAQENPHIGVGYLCAYLRSRGIKPAVLDLNKRFYLNHPDFRMLWHVENKNFWSNENTFLLLLEVFKQDIDRAIEEIISYRCDILGFSVVDPKERLTIEFIKRIKKKCPQKKIILGGPATSTYEQRKIFLDNISEYIDAFVVGEGEETLFSLIERLLTGEEDLTGIRGCYVKSNGKWSYLERPPIVPLDSIPHPTYEEFDLSLYGKSLLVEWSRGCVGRCAFCKNYRLFPIYRAKSPDWVIKELRFHKERYGIEEFTVVDNILNGNLKILGEICDRIIKENLKIKWTGQIAPKASMDYEFFKKMRKAGCFKLQIGLESGSNKILKAMRKTFSAEVSEKNIRYAKKAGIETEIFIMIGFPGEAEKDFKKTYDFIKRNAFYIDTLKSINTLHLIAGTEVYEKREKFKIKPLPKENWHYLWETEDGNNYKIRKKRAEILLDLAYDLGIKVMETNITEGKEKIFKLIKEKNQKEKIELLKSSINCLQKLPQREKKIKKKRSFLKSLILVFLYFFVFLYIVYFWLYMIIKNKILFGGKINKNDK